MFDACREGLVDEVISELRAGGSPRERRHGVSCLQIAGKRGQLEIAHHLIKFGADPNEVIDQHSNTLLHQAARTGNFGFTSLLLDAGAEVDAKNDDHETPLMIASKKGGEFLLERLLMAHANPNQKNLNGDTPLHAAALRGNRDICRLLIQRGASINDQNRQGSTPLDLATVYGNTEAANYLVDCGAMRSESPLNQLMLPFEVHSNALASQQSTSPTPSDDTSARNVARAL